MHSNIHSNSLGMAASCAGMKKIVLSRESGGMERKLRAGVRTEKKLGCIKYSKDTTVLVKL